MSEIRTIFIYLYRYLGEPIYVGQALDPESRDRSHINSRVSSFEKFMALNGRNNFSIEVVNQIYDVPLGILACSLENEMMDKFKTYRPGVPGFNQARAGFNTTLESFRAQHAATKAGLLLPKAQEILRRPKSAETRAKMKLAQARQRDMLSAKLKGRPKSFETREKMKASFTTERKQEISKRFKGKKLSPELIEKIRERMNGPNNPHRGKPGHPHTEEYKKWMSEWQKKNSPRGMLGKKQTDEAKEKCRLAKLGDKNPASRPEVKIKVVHKRWHLRRGIIEVTCPLCVPAKQTSDLRLVVNA